MKNKHIPIQNIREIHIVHLIRRENRIYMNVRFDILMSILDATNKHTKSLQFDYLCFYNEIFTFFSYLQEKSFGFKTLFNELRSSSISMIEFLRICKNKYENIELEPLFYDEHYIKEIEESYRKIFVNIESVDETIKFLI